MNKPQKTILIIDDDAVFSEMLEEKFRELTEYRVVRASDGSQGIEAVHGEKPDAIILDLIMPKLDGIEFLKILRSLPDDTASDTPVLVVTQVGDSDKIAEVTPLGVKGYMVKSDIEHESIIEKVMHLLE